MKQKLAGKGKDSSKAAQKDDNGPSTSKAAQSSKPTTTHRPAAPTTIPREKPPLPVINEANMVQYYAEPLPSFRGERGTERRKHVVHAPRAGSRAYMGLCCCIPSRSMAARGTQWVEGRTMVLICQTALRVKSRAQSSAAAWVQQGPHGARLTCYSAAHIHDHCLAAAEPEHPYLAGA